MNSGVDVREPQKEADVDPASAGSRHLSTKSASSIGEHMEREVPDASPTRNSGSSRKSSTRGKRRSMDVADTGEESSADRASAGPGNSSTKAPLSSLKCEGNVNEQVPEAMDDSFTSLEHAMREVTNTSPAPNPGSPRKSSVRGKHRSIDVAATAEESSADKASAGSRHLSAKSARSRLKHEEQSNEEQIDAEATVAPPRRLSMKSASSRMEAGNVDDENSTGQAFGCSMVSSTKGVRSSLEQMYQLEKESLDGQEVVDAELDELGITFVDICSEDDTAAVHSPRMLRIETMPASVGGQVACDTKTDAEDLKEPEPSGTPGSTKDGRCDQDEQQDHVHTDVSFVASIQSNVSHVASSLERRLERCQSALSQAPLVAVLLSAADAPEFDATLSEAVELVVQAELTYLDRPCKLWVCKPKDWLGRNMALHAEALLDLEKDLRSALKGRFAHDGPCIWPIQSLEHAYAIMQLEELELLFDSGSHTSCCHRMLSALRILPQKRSFAGIIRGHFGPSIAYNYSWLYVWVQNLWVVGLICFCILCASVRPPQMADQKEEEGRISWEVCKLILCLWFVMLPLTSHLLIPKLEPLAVAEDVKRDKPAQLRTMSWEEISKAIVFNPDTSCKNPSYNRSESWRQFSRRYAMILLCLVGIWVLLGFLRNLFIFYVWLIMKIIYDWGECLAVDPPCGSPDGPDDKYYPMGTLLEIGIDVALAILFEAFTFCSLSLGSWLADLSNHSTVEAWKCTKESVALVIASLERLSFLMILGMFFAPQWEKPDKNIASSMLAMSDCFETPTFISLLTDNHAIFSCLRSRLPYENRLHVFAKLVRGPFMVAPFVGIIVKIIIPLLVERLDFWHRSCRCCMGCLDLICRVLSFIFVYDSDAVGGLRFIAKGWPFMELKVVSWAASAGSGQSLSEALEALDVCDPSLRPWLCCRRRSPQGRRGDASYVCETRRSATTPQAPPSSEDEAATRTAVEARLQLVLQQGARKPFEPESELLQTKMNTIFVAFFVAVMPYGIEGALFTLAAKLIELKFSLSKLVFVRRRIFPRSDRAMRRTQRSFLFALAAGLPAWSVLLSLITYNENLHTWGGDGTSASRSRWDRVWRPEPKNLVLGAVLLWLLLDAFLFMISSKLSRKRFVIIAFLAPSLWLVLVP